MYKVLVLGSGCLGKLITKYLVPNFLVTNISIRATHDMTFLFNTSFDIIVDCMDPASFAIANVDSLLSKINSFRLFLYSNASQAIYFYISSAAVYSPSDSIIDEDTNVDLKYINSASEYIQYKFRAECFYQEYFPGSYFILRPVALWSASLPSTHSSFFCDLIKSRQSNLTLPSFDSDFLTITYLSFSDAARIISRIILKSFDRSFQLINVTSGCWSTRAQLKSESYFRSLNPSFFGHRVVSKFAFFQDCIFHELP